MTAIALTPREQELDAIILAYNDVTERLKGAYETLSREVARLREELARKNRELARRERLAALGQLAAGLAHEVRNPLGGIALYASVLERDLGGQPGPLEVVRKISRGVRSLDRLVGEILEFAQEDVLEREVCRLGDVLAPVLESLAPWIGENDVAIEIEDGAAGMELYADAGRLSRALLNLMINAVQAVGPRGTIGVSAAAARGGMVRVGLWDTGPGIPEAHIEQVFDPFYTTRPSGTGLGLAIVHRIVEAHGGAIRARNRPGGGVEFELILPGSAAAARHAAPDGAGPRPKADFAEGWNRGPAAERGVPDRLAS